eukprot:TRINITY_DN18675_c0_g1_i1.p1 TRINITY_DN18675_c0_g1~~TRINITY_DN18675_c0_g1_i1.p1  ORF type:complete len:380 (+),score=45.93 TRINITY_DN18675_c0_g1_i1:34-1173(+)
MSVLDKLLKHKYTTPEGLKALDDYKYCGIDYSLIANYIMQPFWRKAVNILPETIAPNLVTLIGFGAIILGYLVMTFYCPLFVAVSPLWVHILCAINLFFYQTMDALDGKQARRTNTSSPLGELFDHGCDAVTTFLVALTVSTSISLGPNYYTFILVIGSLAPFYLKQLEEYHTDEMILGYVNVTEAQLVTISCFLVSGIFGPEAWNTEFNLYVAVLSLRQLVFFSSVGGMCYICLTSFDALFKRAKNRNHALAQTFPIFFVLISSFVWSYLSPDILGVNAHFFYLAVGFAVANVVGKMVIARVCRLHFDEKQIIIFLPLTLGVINAIFGFVAERTFLIVYCLVSTIAYAHLALSIIHDFCRVLEIRCLSIYPKPKPKKT